MSKYGDFPDRYEKTIDYQKHIVRRQWKYNTGWNRSTAAEVEIDGTWDGEGGLPCGHTPKTLRVSNSGRWFDICSEGHVYERLRDAV